MFDCVTEAQSLSKQGVTIQRERLQLVDLIRRTDQIFTVLLQNAALTTQEHDRLRSQTNTCDSIQTLLDLLKEKPDFAYNSFLEALKNTNQEHLYRLLTEKGKLNTQSILACYRFGQLIRELRKLAHLVRQTSRTLVNSIHVVSWSFVKKYLLPHFLSC